MNPHRARRPVDEFDDSPIKYPSQLPPNSDGKNPHVLIVGAGLSGLLLAILLDKAGIPYEIYERAASVKPLGMVGGNERFVSPFSCKTWFLSSLFLGTMLGSIMSLNANILGAIEQIGLLDELKAISFPSIKTNIMYDNMKIAASFGSIDKNGE